VCMCDYHRSSLIKDLDSGIVLLQFCLSSVNFWVQCSVVWFSVVECS